MASKSTILTAKTQQLDSKTNHTVHPNPKGSTQRKASGIRTTNPSQFKESKASSKSSAIQKPSPGFNDEAYKSKNSAENLSADLEFGKNNFTQKKGLFISTSALADLSPPLNFSPRMKSAKTKPGSAPAKSPNSLGPTKESQRSFPSLPGNCTAMFKFFKKSQKKLHDYMLSLKSLSLELGCHSLIFNSILINYIYLSEKIHNMQNYYKLQF